MFTMIPDIHADPRLLDACLSMAAGSTPAFLGDFIDAGTGVDHADDAAVLTRVRALIDAGEALAVMGNHELNAILFHRRGPDGDWLRRHSAKNRKQHRSFIEAFGIATPKARDWTGWLLSALPLWHEGEGFRLVHACWDEVAIARIRARRPDGRLHPEDLPEIADESTDFGRAVKLITSGREVRLPEGWAFHDKNGDRRHHVRLSWWRAGRTWRDAALSVPDRTELPGSPLPAGFTPAPWPDSAPPVFVGHYKMQGTPCLEAAHALCLDYPQTPCLYRWQGEARLLVGHLHVVPRHKITLAGNPLTSTGAGISTLCSTGRGGMVLDILFRTHRDDAGAVTAAMGLQPAFRTADPDGAFFTWNPTGRQGDDETIVHTLNLLLPPDISRRIIWEESEY